jgi:hypothetical protein
MEHGIAHLANSRSGSRWRIHRPDDGRLSGFRGLREYPRRVLTMTGQMGDAAHKAVVGMDGGSWRILHTAESNDMRGWYDELNPLWIENNNALVVCSESNDIAVGRQGPLGGFYFDFLLQSGTTFWIATAPGAARHTPLLWSSPAPGHPTKS